MAPTNCVTLLTDYGLEDGFVAACHGVIVRISPSARIIDISHLVPPGDVRRGAALLAQTVPYLPEGVHVAVVDPGVGTARRAVAVATGNRIFVGPDNGVLSWSIPDGGARAFELTNSKLWLEPLSATFHGRDMFAPVAAHLAAGLDIASVGTEFDAADLVVLPRPTRRVQEGTVDGEVLTVDRFGNVQLSVTAGDLRRIGAVTGAPLSVTLGRRTLTVPFGETFAMVPPGELVAYIDSVGCLALAVNAGNAAQRLGLPPGAHVRVAMAFSPMR
ncbi:SAM-dependent chlorinase/fluorinase [Actinoallomurus purpureus]|uniref:SAM hydrolase/SAM-dependent halogenase family protein n=1 Tax=Actinoallomurus purpureus TaxID=478114 RepID=UPI002092ACBF|nr:SAM-dependent chlorinase/fluorinase [Actinoallomurus purpureus]MCO6010886.1 SAM-dependent chlorinase/fluorinase [Actinoallomurus purpureus]